LKISPIGWKDAETIQAQGAIKMIAPVVRSTYTMALPSTSFHLIGRMAGVLIGLETVFSVRVIAIASLLANTQRRREYISTGLR
jgi:hypothetical protein